MIQHFVLDLCIHIELNNLLKQINIIENNKISIYLINNHNYKY
jgi:hypothetical protein